MRHTESLFNHMSDGRQVVAAHKHTMRPKRKCTSNYISTAGRVMFALLVDIEQNGTEDAKKTEHRITNTRHVVVVVVAGSKITRHSL